MNAISPPEGPKAKGLFSSDDIASFLPTRQQLLDREEYYSAKTSRELSEKIEGRIEEFYQKLESIETEKQKSLERIAQFVDKQKETDRDLARLSESEEALWAVNPKYPDRRNIPFEGMKPHETYLKLEAAIQKFPNKGVLHALKMKISSKYSKQTYENAKNIESILSQDLGRIYDNQNLRLGCYTCGEHAAEDFVRASFVNVGAWKYALDMQDTNYSDRHSIVQNDLQISKIQELLGKFSATVPQEFRYVLRNRHLNNNELFQKRAAQVAQDKAGDDAGEKLYKSANEFYTTAVEKEKNWLRDHFENGDNPYGRYLCQEAVVAYRAVAKTHNLPPLRIVGEDLKMSKELSEKDAVWTHGAPLHLMESVLKTGSLLSLIEMDKQGMRAIRTHYDPTYGGGTNQVYSKQPDHEKIIEAHNICFGEDRLYKNIDTWPVAIAFSKKDLISRGVQWMDQDGVHALDKNFKRSDRDSPGLAISLKDVPFKILVATDHKEKLRSFLVEESAFKEQLSKLSSQDRGRWLDQRVVPLEGNTWDIIPTVIMIDL